MVLSKPLLDKKKLHPFGEGTVLKKGVTIPGFCVQPTIHKMFFSVRRTGVTQQIQESSGKSGSVGRYNPWDK